MSPAASPLRHLPLPGSRNLRDLGGYASSVDGGGLSIRWGCVYRSGHFGDLTSEGQRKLAALRIATVIDFRTAAERERHPSRFDAGHAPRILEVPIDPGSGQGFAQAMGDRDRTADGMALLMEEMNRSLVREHSEPFRQMFESLVREESGAHVIHCASGKDRTGVGAALMLAALGVELETIVDDFLLTNQTLDIAREVGTALKDFGGPAAKLTLPPEELKPIFEVRAGYILSAFDEIEGELGGLDAYLEERMGLGADELPRLRSRFLTSDPRSGRC